MLPSGLTARPLGSLNWKITLQIKWLDFGIYKVFSILFLYLNIAILTENVLLGFPSPNNVLQYPVVLSMLLIL